jgi:proline iminopeptidase
MGSGLVRFGGAYYAHRPAWQLAHALLRGEWRAKVRPDALIHAGRTLMPGWSVMDRLGEISVPTLVIAGREDFVFPPEHQVELAAGIPNSRLHLVERAGHNPHEERTSEVLAAVTDFCLQGHLHIV